MESLGDVAVAFIYESFITGKYDPQSDVDLMIVGRIEMRDLDDKLDVAEEKIGREITYRLVAPKRRKSELSRGATFLKKF